MAPPPLAVCSPSLLQSVYNSQIISPRKSKSQGEPSQPITPLVQSSRTTISPRIMTSQGELSQPTAPLVQSPILEISPRGLTSQGEPSQPTPPLAQSPKPTIYPRNLSSQDTGFRYENFNVRELLEEANDERSNISPLTAAQNEVQTNSERNPVKNTSMPSEEFSKIPSLTSNVKMEHIIIEKMNPDSTAPDGHGVMDTEIDGLRVTALQNSLNSNQLDSITDVDDPAKSLNGSESSLSSDATIPKESMGNDRDHVHTNYTSPQSTHAHGAQELVDNIYDGMPAHCAPDLQQECVHIGNVIQHTHQEEEPEQVISQMEHAYNSLESEHAHNSLESEHAHNIPGIECAHNNPESEQAHISCESFACSGQERVPPVSNSIPLTIQLNNLTNTTSQLEFDVFLQQLFAASQSIPQEELNPDPIQNMLTMLSHWEFSVSQSHQKRKLALAEECEKKLEQVRKKYAILVQNEEALYNQRLKELQNTPQKNQYLAETSNSNSIENNSHVKSEKFQGTSNSMQQHTPPPGFSLRSIRPETSQVQNSSLFYTPPSSLHLHSSRISTPSACQMRNMDQQFPTTNVIETPNLHLCSNSAPPQPFCSSPPRMALPPLAVCSPSLPQSVYNSQIISIRKSKSQGEPSQPITPLVQSSKSTISPRIMTSQGEPSQPTPPLAQSPKPTIYPRNLSSQGKLSQPTPPLAQSSKPTIYPRNLSSQGEPSKLIPPHVQSPKPTIIFRRNVACQGELSQHSPRPMRMPHVSNMHPRNIWEPRAPAPHLRRLHRWN